MAARLSLSLVSRAQAVQLSLVSAEGTHGCPWCLLVVLKLTWHPGSLSVTSAC